MSVTQTAPGDTPLADIAEGVQEAERAILGAVRTDPTRAWTLQDLIEVTPGPASDSVMSIAFWTLIEHGKLEADEQLVVHLGPKA